MPRPGFVLEVDRNTFENVCKSWNDETRYPALRFQASLANAAPPWRERLLGVVVDAGVRDHESRPFGGRTRGLVAKGDRAWLDSIGIRGGLRDAAMNRSG